VFGALGLQLRVPRSKSQDARVALVDNCDPNTFPARLCVVLPEQQREDPVQLVRASRFHEADGLPEMMQGYVVDHIVRLELP
jgi:hypothetical protein